VSRTPIRTGGPSFFLSFFKPPATTSSFFLFFYHLIVSLFDASQRIRQPDRKSCDRFREKKEEKKKSRGRQTALPRRFTRKKQETDKEAGIVGEREGKSTAVVRRENTDKEGKCEGRRRRD